MFNSQKIIVFEKIHYEPNAQCPICNGDLSDLRLTTGQIQRKCLGHCGQTFYQEDPESQKKFTSLWCDLCLSALAAKKGNDIADTPERKGNESFDAPKVKI